MKEAFVVNFIFDELSDLAAGIILFPLVVVAKVLRKLLVAFNKTE